jgi:hypothetical protein
MLEVKDGGMPDHKRFVEIAQEAYDTRPRVFCPRLRSSGPEGVRRLAARRTPRLSWYLVHDEVGNYVEKTKASLSMMENP